jgi:hypothetical protein
VISEAQAVFGVKAVTAIPLEEDRARTVLNTLATKQASVARPSLMPGLSVDSVLRARQDSIDDADDGEDRLDFVQPSVTQEDNAPRVKFADHHQVKVMSPLHASTFDRDDDDRDTTPPTPSSTTSTLSETSNKTNALANTIAERLSFWNRLPKRSTGAASSAAEAENEVRKSAEEEHKLLEEPEATHGVVDPSGETVKDPIGENEEQAPGEMLHTMVQETAPTPISQAVQHAQLENKIVRETIREYTAKGGMYFSYTFGQCLAVHIKHSTHAEQTSRDRCSTNKKKSASLREKMLYLTALLLRERRRHL